MVNKKSKWLEFRLHMVRFWTLYVMLAIPLSQVVIFRYGPMINILAAFKENKFLWPVMERAWAGNHGFEFFIKAFDNPLFMESLRNTFVLSILQILIGFPIPIILALFLNELRSTLFKRFTQTILYMPNFLSWAIIGGMATGIFGAAGLVNNALGTSIPFLTSSTHWIFSYVFIGIWQSMGWNTIIFLAAIAGVNPELYEAAAVDGAKRFRMMWHVTLPSIRSVIIILLLLNVGGIMGNNFERIMAMRNPLVYGVSDVIEVFVYDRGIRGMDQSLAAAVGLFQSIVSVVLLFSANAIAKRAGERGIM
ncbi:MAG: ABC transporter permease subunit [Lachnospiraceae bacterium]|nr:ABC transporter permease subunit [Lachnospiraceae bacterium]